MSANAVVGIVGIVKTPRFKVLTISTISMTNYRLSTFLSPLISPRSRQLTVHIRRLLVKALIHSRLFLPLVGEQRGDTITNLEKRLLLAYFYNNKCRLEATVKQLQLNLRYRHFYSVDVVEFLYASQELENFNQFSKDVMSLLKLK